ncbi:MULTISPECIES: septal ring lytic transglycosylase RlpA family protein [Fusobacterium]|jgi:rare lipoprotein A|uniref:Septal ring lytic transglycosylase RlpA family protein n=1 Tax=Fusobacterium hominis TaxID=2764326 RepID=A0A7G9GY01_9FUSO|nr:MULTISPECIES: septal ring lytic transglycosylase RlpA family protein [Fusobacterium]QNM15683.1 septal ring lytic transglycosylase RlpA family protein [Fusobacterium hominis]
MKKNLVMICVFLFTSVRLFATASWYGKGFEGKLSASGYVYAANQLTCASNDHPFGTVLKVTNKANMKSVMVVVLDRGSFKEKYGRKIDLSKEAFTKIAKIGEGLINVKIEVMSKNKSFKYKHGKPVFTAKEYDTFLSDIKG